MPRVSKLFDIRHTDDKRQNNVTLFGIRQGLDLQVKFKFR